MSSQWPLIERRAALIEQRETIGLISVEAFASYAGLPARSSRMKVARDARGSRTNSETSLQTRGRVGEIDAQNMGQCGIGLGACATGRPPLGTAAHSKHCGRL